ncbi:DNA polymerase V [Vibrio crassostreae]|uniref:S24 family peptidase n=1 Tax=Vibrio sp. 624788 TaxID=1234362 RepID=UPI00047452C6|nr:S24 family peptidase [Vibrio sp. 624788]CAK1715345.1 DNA polymerase V [Vibrio crassostreae]CAK1716471.1 DNA polymerase V [Vibrio crassostreae]CAK2535635.1 DNA polymerase V [Vibrio crassostreae]CAK2539167.1 DNA polymerase V [Vibrio crassostreae]CAK2592670.1 DNA polymerase V [Vibrio crassostreae]
MKAIQISASAGVTGFESPAAEYTQLPIDLDELLVEHPSATFLGQACGDSMQGLGSFDGDLLKVGRHVQVKHLGVIVANFNGEFVCKLIDAHRRLLLSANESVQPVVINEFNNFTQEGVVIRSIRCHRSSNLLGGD